MPVAETKIFYAILVAAGMILLIFIMFLISMLRQYKKNRELYKQKLVAEINGAENERSQLARDLHDDIGPLLAAIRMQIRKASPESLDKAVRYTDDVISQVRAVSHKLLPVSLTRAGLKEALQEYCDTISENGELNIIYKFDENISAGENDIHIYRIVHEILHNTLKHAKATVVNLSVYNEKHNLIIEIGDNGIGADMQRHRKIGLGLMNIASRVELLQGDMYIDSALGKGVQYKIEIPFSTISKQPPETMNYNENRISNPG